MKNCFAHIAAIVAGMVSLSSCSTLLYDSSPTAAVYSSSTAVYDNGYSTTSYSSGYGGDYQYYGSGRTASGIAYEQARREAYYLSDKMAYELGLTDDQFEAIYEINLDYLLSMKGEQSIYGDYWTRRNSDIFFVLDARQYNRYIDLEYFYRPVYWYDNDFTLSVYHYYDSPTYYYRSRPVYYDSYRGGRNLQTKSYYAGRFGSRSGSPVITPRSSTPAYGSASGRSVVTTTRPSGTYSNRTNTSVQTNSSFGNGRRPTTTTTTTTQRSNNSSYSFGNARNQRPTQPQNNNYSSTTIRTTTTTNFGSGTPRSQGGTTVQTTTRDSRFGGSRSSNTSSQPTRSSSNQRNPQQNNGSFGGSR